MPLICSSLAPFMKMWRLGKLQELVRHTTAPHPDPLPTRPTTTIPGLWIRDRASSFRSPMHPTTPPPQINPLSNQNPYFTTTDTVFSVRIPTLQLPIVKTPTLQPVCCVCLCVCQPVFDAMILLLPREQ